MSIGPVQGFRPVIEAQSANGNLRVEQSQVGPAPGRAAEKLDRPNPATLPKQEKTEAKNIPTALELPQDEVQVQWDAQVKDQMVVKYLDKTTGDVILQVPSAQLLDVDRGIFAELQNQTKSRDNAVAATGRSERGEPNGH